MYGLFSYFFPFFSLSFPTSFSPTPHLSLSLFPPHSLSSLSLYQYISCSLSFTSTSLFRSLPTSDVIISHLKEKSEKICIFSIRKLSYCQIICGRNLVKVFPQVFISRKEFAKAVESNTLSGLQESLPYQPAQSYRRLKYSESLLHTRYSSSGISTLPIGKRTRSRA